MGWTYTRTSQSFSKLEELERSSGVASGQMKTTKHMVFCDVPIFAFSRRTCRIHKTPLFNIEPSTSSSVPTIECSLFFVRKQVGVCPKESHKSAWNCPYFPLEEYTNFFYTVFESRLMLSLTCKRTKKRKEKRKEDIDQTASASYIRARYALWHSYQSSLRKETVLSSDISKGIQ